MYSIFFYKTTHVLIVKQKINNYYDYTIDFIIIKIIISNAYQLKKLVKNLLYTHKLKLNKAAKIKKNYKILFKLIFVTNKIYDKINLLHSFLPFEIFFI